MYVTLFTEPFAAPTNDGGDNILIASWMKAFCKQCNFLWSGKEYIVRKTQPGFRGAVAANGVPAATGTFTNDAAGIAAAIAADNALMQTPTTFQVIWGAKRYPQQEARGGELITMQKKAQGLTSYREGAGQAESDPTIRKVFAMDLEKVSANLDGMGASSRAGEQIIVSFEHAGTDTIFASKVFCVLTYTQKLELRTGSVRTMD